MRLGIYERPSLTVRDVSPEDEISSGCFSISYSTEPLGAAGDETLLFDMVFSLISGKESEGNLEMGHSRGSDDELRVQ